jgi:hypothetical protein
VRTIHQNRFKQQKFRKSRIEYRNTYSLWLRDIIWTFPRKTRMILLWFPRKTRIVIWFIRSSFVRRIVVVCKSRPRKTRIGSSCPPHTAAACRVQTLSQKNENRVIMPAGRCCCLCPCSILILSPNEESIGMSHCCTIFHCLPLQWPASCSPCHPAG